MKRIFFSLAPFALLFASVPLSSEPISAATHTIVLEIGAILGIPKQVVDALQIEESGDRKTGAWGDALAVGPVGSDGVRCLGLYQLNPRGLDGLVKDYYPHKAKYFDVFNPIDNSVVALSYLAALHKKHGTWERALWAYNCGKVVNVPDSTRGYAARIIGKQK